MIEEGDCLLGASRMTETVEGNKNIGGNHSLRGRDFKFVLQTPLSPQKEKSKFRFKSISVFVIIIFLSFSISFRIVTFFLYKLYQYFSLSLDISFLYKSFFLLFVSLFISFFFSFFFLYFVWFFHCFLLLPCLSLSDVALMTVMTLIFDVFIWNFERKFHLIFFSFFRTAEQESHAVPSFTHNLWKTS